MMIFFYKGTMSVLLSRGCGLCCVSVVMDEDQLLLLLKRGTEILFPSRSVETGNPVTLIFLPWNGLFLDFAQFPPLI